MKASLLALRRLLATRSAVLSYLALYLAAMVAAVIAFGVMLGQNPGSEREMLSLIGFAEFLLITVLCMTAWGLYAMKKNAAPKKPSVPTPPPAVREETAAPVSTAPQPAPSPKGEREEPKKSSNPMVASLKSFFLRMSYSAEERALAREMSKKKLSVNGEINRLVSEVSEKVGITAQLDKRPTQLSGGQQQRVAIARAIVKKPEILLMDEPLSNLDAKLRVETRTWIRQIQKQLGLTTIFVTHDQEEALSISDRIFVMGSGVIQQEGAPYDVYSNPKNMFVASFMGSPEMNFFDAEADAKGRVSVVGTPLNVQLPVANRKVVIGIRPEGVLNHEFASQKVEEYPILNDTPIPAKVRTIEQLGRERVIHLVGPSGKDIKSIFYMSKPLREGEEFGIALKKGAAHIFDAETKERLGEA